MNIEAPLQAKHLIANIRLQTTATGAGASDVSAGTWRYILEIARVRHNALRGLLVSCSPMFASSGLGNVMLV